jgi:hypothetical protein
VDVYRIKAGSLKKSTRDKIFFCHQGITERIYLEAGVVVLP